MATATHFPPAPVTPLQFVPYDQLAGRPNVIVDGSATERLTLLVTRGRRHEVVCRYEGWIQLRSRPLRQRVDLGPLAVRLTELESGGVTWTAAGPGSLLAGRSVDGDAESSIDPARVRSLVEAHLATAPPAWDPYPHS